MWRRRISVLSLKFSDCQLSFFLPSLRSYLLSFLPSRVTFPFIGIQSQTRKCVVCDARAQVRAKYQSTNKYMHENINGDRKCVKAATHNRMGERK